MQLLVFLLILSVVVLVHELGHMLAAKRAGIKVEEFGFGLPPRLWRLFRRGETEYTINLLPIGGFVRLYGENGEIEAGIPDERAYWSKSIWQRGLVLVSGVVMNFLLAVVLFGAVYSVLGVPVRLEGVEVTEVRSSSPAAEVGMKAGDVILAAAGVEIESSKHFLELVAESKGEKVELKLRRDGEEVSVVVVPRVSPPEGEGALGVMISDTRLQHFPWWQMPFRGVAVGFAEAFSWGRQIVTGLVEMVVRLVTGKGIDARNLAGPVGIYQISNEARKAGWLVMLQFVGILSVNLAVLNLLPLPALDGGRVVFLGIELVRGKRIKPELEGWVNTLGMAFLLALMVLVTFNDIVRLIGGWEVLGVIGR